MCPDYGGEGGENAILSDEICVPGTGLVFTSILLDTCNDPSDPTQSRSTGEREVCLLSVQRIWITSSHETLFTKTWLFGDHLYDFGPTHVF